MKNSVRFYFLVLLVRLSRLLLLLSFLLRAQQLEDQRRQKETKTEREVEVEQASHWLPPSHVETFFQFLRAGLLQWPLGK